MKIKYLFLLYFAIHLTPLYSQSLEETDSQKAAELEKQIAVLEERINSLSDDNEQFYTEMRIWREAASYIIFKEFWGIIALILGFLGVSSIWGIPSLAKKYAESTFRRRIESLFKIKSELLENILIDAEETTKSKREKITVISKEPDNLDFLRSFFTAFGFQKICYKSIEEKIDKRKRFLIINNENKSMTDDEIKTIVGRNDKIPTLIFQAGRIDGLFGEEISFANSRNTLYSRIIESLLFGRVINSL